MHREDRTRRRIGSTGMGMPTLILSLLMLATSVPAMAQKAVPSLSGVENVDPRRIEPGIEKTAAQRKMFREITDSNSGARWILWSDPAHPGGPGYLAPAPREAGTEALKNSTDRSDLNVAIAAPCIHVGDKIVVEEHTAAADVTLQAMAMEPAGMGSSFQARLRFGGKVVGAVALGPGRATLAPAAEVKR
jgi:hypothetical protein